MAAAIYLDIVHSQELGKDVCVHSLILNPSEKHNKSHNEYFRAANIGNTKIKLAELCRILETAALPKKSQVVVFSQDAAITRTGSAYGVEEGEKEAQHCKMLWKRLEAVCKRKELQMSYAYKGLMTDAFRDETRQYVDNLIRKNKSADTGEGVTA